MIQCTSCEEWFHSAASQVLEEQETYLELQRLPQLGTYYTFMHIALSPLTKQYA